MDAMYLNLMFINPRPPPVGAGAEGARCTRPSWTPPPLQKILDPRLCTHTGPYPGLTGARGRGSLIGCVCVWGGGGDARHRHRVDLEGSGGMLLQNYFFINLIEYSVSFCILKYKSLSLYL